VRTIIASRIIPLRKRVEVYNGSDEPYPEEEYISLKYFDPFLRWWMD